jgi:L-methionine (R)-S-oxide reductase
MFEVNEKMLDYSNAKKFWDELVSEAQGMRVEELIPNLANFSALVFSNLPDVNWVGFYLFDGKKLVLGPFQGKPACIYIPLDRGVCGLAARELKSVIVDDVSQFSDHIACDSETKSELVVPFKDSVGNLLGVFDLDSPKPGRFTEFDQVGAQKIADLISKAAI